MVDSSSEQTSLSWQHPQKDEASVFIKHACCLVTVMEEEARGVQEAISWIEEMGMQGITIECDSELVVRAIHSTMEYYLEVGHIVEFCRLKLK